MEEKRFFGTEQHPYTSYNCGDLEDTYIDVAVNHVQVKEEIQFPEMRLNLLNKYSGLINV